MAVTSVGRVGSLPPVRSNTEGTLILIRCDGTRILYQQYGKKTNSAVIYSPAETDGQGKTGRT